ncbi:MAG: 5-oxoprolinase subunit PxpA [Pseudomonadota bacterium]
MSDHATSRPFPHGRLKLNCDLGEGFGPWTMGEDEAVMPLIDQANIACGFHASDPLTMRRTVRLALKHGVGIGAHPGYPDLLGFGRRSMPVEHDELVALLRYQVGALDAIARAEGGRVDYVKPHGALYNDMMRTPHVLRAMLEAVAGMDGGLALMVLCHADNTHAQGLAGEYGVPLLFEAFADRAYEPDGSLRPRGQPGAVHAEVAAIIEQALRLAHGEPLPLTAPSGTTLARHKASPAGRNPGMDSAEDGTSLVLQADSLCVHGDTPQALAALRAIREALGPRA